jgi:hypothetical protein
LAVSAAVFAQAPDQAAIDKALVAAPAQLKAAATVIKWKADYTYDTLKKGTSKLVCYDKSGLPGQAAYMVECTSLGNLERAAQNLKFEAMGAQKQAALDAAEKDGTRVKPEFGSVWYHSMGDPANPRSHDEHRRSGRHHQDPRLPETGASGGVWIMNADHHCPLMTPGE